MEGFTPILSTLGGVLIGLAALALLYFNGRIAGISGILGHLLRPRPGDVAWRAVFLIGLGAGALLLLWVHPVSLDLRFDVADPVVILGGFLVGLGTRFANGCTSGHGVCGIGRVAPRSIAASAVFVSVAAITAYLLRHGLPAAGL